MLQEKQRHARHGVKATTSNTNAKDLTAKAKAKDLTSNIKARDLTLKAKHLTSKANDLTSNAKAKDDIQCRAGPSLKFSGPSQAAYYRPAKALGTKWH